MKSSSDKHLLENKVFKWVMAVILSLFGLTLFSVTAGLWHWLSAEMISVTLIYGCVLLFAALYAWRIESSEVTNKLHTACFWLMSAGMIGVVVFTLMTKPSVLDLPFYHPKPLSCLAMLTSATIFAYKAWKGRLSSPQLKHNKSCKPNASRRRSGS